VEKSDLWHLAIVPAEPGRFVSHIGADVRVSPTRGWSVAVEDLAARPQVGGSVPVS
jgi:hypothetical protein